MFFPGIQALRAIAATLVVLEHALLTANAYEWRYLPFSFGRVGVVLFFAISGFVIALNRSRPVAEFAISRFLRIYPGYWIAMLCASSILTLVGTPISVIPSEVFLYPTMVENSSLTIPYWTLIFEMTFYVLATVAFALKLSDRTLTLVAIAWIVAVNIFASGDPAKYAFPGWWIWLSPAVQVFPLGMICGIHFDRLRSGGRWPISVAAILACGLSYNLEWFTAAKLLTTGFACAMILLIGADLRVPLLAKKMGDASYGIYLLHFPLLAATAAAGFPSIFAIALVGGTLFGLFEHWLYERFRGDIARWLKSPASSAEKAPH